MQQDTLLLNDLLQSQRTCRLIWGLARFMCWEDVPQLLQFVEELLHVSSIVILAEALGPSFPRLNNGILIIFSKARVYQVSTDEYCCASLAGMAMHEHFASLLDHEVHDLNDV